MKRKRRKDGGAMTIERRDHARRMHERRRRGLPLYPANMRRKQPAA